MKKLTLLQSGWNGLRTQFGWRKERLAKRAVGEPIYMPAPDRLADRWYICQLGSTFLHLHLYMATLHLLCCSLGSWGPVFKLLTTGSLFAEAERIRTGLDNQACLWPCRGSSKRLKLVKLAKLAFFSADLPSRRWLDGGERRAGSSFFFLQTIRSCSLPSSLCLLASRCNLLKERERGRERENNIVCDASSPFLSVKLLRIYVVRAWSV